MSSKVYILRVNLGEHPGGSVIVRTDDGWLIGNLAYDRRGSIKDGETAMLLDWITGNKLTSIIEELEEDE